MKRITKNITPVITTREDADNRLRDLAIATSTRAGLVAEMDQEIIEIKGIYAAEISRQDDLIQAASADLEAWALAHPSDFIKPKSIEMLHGTIGFRTGTPKLKLLRGWTWEKVTQAVGVLLPNFIRNKPEVDREAILGQRDELAEFLPSVGLKVDQDEAFFLIPKLTDPETKATA
jgi:phage host-nuclease inhibitor protein Gam